MDKAAKVTSYKDLIVYQKSKSLTLDIIKYFSKEKTVWTKQFLLNQLFRSVSSVAANITEGFGRNYSGSFRNFVSIARGSSFETSYWLDILNDLNDYDKNIMLTFVQRNSEINKMLTGLMKNMKGGNA